MATVKQLSKTPAGPLGNFKYKFECKCSNGTKKKDVEVTSANDNSAKELALAECKENCGEPA